MRMLGRAAVTLWLLLAGAVPAAGQDAIDRLIGRPIAAVQFEIEGRPVSLPALDALVAIKPGDTFQLDAIRDAESHLIAGGYEDVDVRAAEGPAGLALVFNLTPRHPVEELEFRGDTGLGAAALRGLVVERYGGVPAREQPASVARSLERMLQDEGFPDARVDSQIVVAHDPERATMVFDVAAGRRLIIARTIVENASPLGEQEIRARTPTAAGQPFRRFAVEVALAEIEEQLRDDEYYEAVAMIAGDPTVSPEGVTLTLRVTAGPRVIVRWEGLAQIPDDDLADRLVPLRRMRSADEDLLEDSDTRVISHFRREGYRDVRVTHTREQQDDQLIITMQVDRGVRYVMDSLEVTGNAHVGAGDVREDLGDAVSPGRPYDQDAIVAGIGRLRTRYLRLGYYTVSVMERDPEEVPGTRTAAEVRVKVTIDINEGPQARIGAIRLTGVRADLEAAVRGGMRSQTGQPYVEEFVRLIDEPQIEQFYRDLGFENVNVAIAPTPVDQAATPTVDLVVTVNEGPQIFVGDITITGNRRISEERIRERMTLREGQPFGEAARLESHRRIAEMAGFRRVTIDEQPRIGGETIAHVVVTVEEQPAWTIAYGGGLEGGRQPLATSENTTEDRVFLAPRGAFEIGRRNLWGKNRSINFFSRVAPRPTTTVDENFGFLEYRASVTYQEPRAFNRDLDLNLILASEQVARTGFNYARRTAALQALRRVSERVTVTARYGLDHTRLFDVDPNFTSGDRTALARLFTVGRLVPLYGGVVWDRRDDSVNPSRGTLAGADFEITARKFGSEVGYAKTFMHASGYRAVVASRRTVVAGRIELGLARGFSRVALDENGDPLFDESGAPVTVSDLPVGQRFFAGGSTTVRGFQLDRLGRPDVLSTDGLSLGGNGMVVANGELRTTVGRLAGRDLGAAFFTDIGNVFRRASDIDFTKLRMTLGFGLRYNSPLGPIRLDFGFKTDRQMVGGGRERGWEYHLNIGEAF